MAFGEWMVPRLTHEAEFQLRASELTFQNAAQESPEALAVLASQLMRQTLMQDCIIRKATMRIAELEGREALSQKSDSSEWLEEAQRIRPASIWGSLALAWHYAKFFAARFVWT